MPKKQKITGPGVVRDRSAKGGKLEIVFDPSPNGFLSAARRAKERLKVQVIPDDPEITPIELLVKEKLWAFKFTDAAVEPGRLADLETLITEQRGCHISIEYTPQQEDLPGLDSAEGS